MEDAVDAIYGDKYTTLCAGLVVVTAIVFRDKIRLCESRTAWLVLNCLFLITLFLYESNESLAFMMGALIVSGTFQKSTVKTATLN